MDSHDDYDYPYYDGAINSSNQWANLPTDLPSSNTYVSGYGVQNNITGARAGTFNHPIAPNPFAPAPRRPGELRHTAQINPVGDKLVPRRVSIDSFDDYPTIPSPPPPPQPEKAPERTTISDDRSAGSNLEVRNLAALKDRTASRPVQLTTEGIIDDRAFRQHPEIRTSRHGNTRKSRLADYGPDYGSFLGYARTQQRFGRLQLEDITRRDSKAREDGSPKEATDKTGFPERRTQSKNGLIIKEHWVQEAEKTVTDNRLQSDIEMIQSKMSGMQKKLRQLEVQKSRYAENQYRILYRIDSTCYFDHPEWTQGHKSIVSRMPVKNLDLFLERNKNILFIVYRDFEKTSGEQKHYSKLPQPESARESIHPVSRRLRKALDILLKHDWRYESMFLHLQQQGEIKAPYLFVYHHRVYWKDMLMQFPDAVRKHLNLLAIYVSDNYGQEYEAADAAFAQRRISVEHVKYLFQPGDILISRTNGQYRGLVANSWPEEVASKPTSGRPAERPRMRRSYHDASHAQSFDSDVDDSDFDIDEIVHGPSDADEVHKRDAMRWAFRRIPHWLRLKENDQEKTASTEEPSKEFSVRVWKWSFDGDFKREADKVTVRLSHAAENVSTEGKMWGMHELDLYPLKFAPEMLVQELRKRGMMFWECRKRRLISYRETSSETQSEFEERFMIDFHTFRKLHPENKSHAILDPVETMSQKEMDQSEPPDEAFYYLVPLHTKGFNLRTKKWLDLNMDQISLVSWNQEAFDSLVLERKTKDLITALVSKQISTAKSTDVIAGKGNGLILLLHGGPGTGKTLTAEGVAEIAKKPLYRVTCGDVGTKAEEVEGYLESVLHLGKIWDCVVLLDEAEVFLERRSLDDLQRNALVSVFLRVIEYHEGILILTSNRVGTFDEAFRSRIQIAVHYPPLGPFQRLQIWNNFFDRLESFKDGTVNVDELRDHLEELQAIEMNGRQIRNAITTARQYAEWKEKPMNYEHLTTALEVAGRFNDYSEKLRGGLTDDQIAEEEGIR